MRTRSADAARGRDRAEGALVGLALGDALGMPTQTLSREVIGERYGIVDRFHPGPPDNEISGGMPPARVTDDTDQAVILGELLVEGRGAVDPHVFAKRLLEWQERMRAAGSLDLLGPSTVCALTLVTEGVSVDESGRWGDTNGAAMRVAPVGVAVAVHSGTDLDAAPFDVSALVDAVESVSRVTHNTGLAIAGASAVAAAVSAGVAGEPFERSLEFAITAAERGRSRGYWAAGADIAERIRWAISLISGRSGSDALDVVSRLVGTSVATQEAVPAAFAMASLSPTDVWNACRLAASVGGDCDTIAAMAGAIVGAHCGAQSIPKIVRDELQAANPELRLERLADDVLRLRHRRERRERQ